MTNEQRYPLTIDPDLFAQWQQCTRKGDAVEITKLLHVSKSTVDRALQFGNVKAERVEAITNYFASRMEREKEQAQRLQALYNPNALKPPPTTMGTTTKVFRFEIPKKLFLSWGIARTSTEAALLGALESNGLSDWEYKQFWHQKTFSQAGLTYYMSIIIKSPTTTSEQPNP